MKEIKLGDFGSIFKNSRNNQVSFVLKSRKLKKFGLTKEQLMNAKIFPKELKVLTLEKKKKD